MTNKLAKFYFYLLISVVSCGFLLLPTANIIESGWPKEYNKRSFDGLFSLDFLETHINYSLFNLGVSGNYKKIVIGTDGWMFLGDFYKKGLSRNRNIESSIISDQEIDRWISSMIARKAWLASKGVEMIFAIAPNKHSIYPEFLPEWMSIQHPNSTDRLVARSKIDGFNIIDMRVELLELKKSTPFLYNRTDTHWTGLGAYFGYRMLMQSLEELRPDISYVSLNELIYTPITRRSCCLAGMLKINKQQGKYYDNDYSINFDGAKNTICVAELSYTEGKKEECKIFMNKRLSIHKSAAEVQNEFAKNNLNVMILRDSFGGTHNRLINDAFSMARHYHYNKIKNEKAFKDLVEKNQPDVVIYQVVERAVFGKRFTDFSINAMAGAR